MSYFTDHIDMLVNPEARISWDLGDDGTLDPHMTSPAK